MTRFYEDFQAHRVNVEYATTACRKAVERQAGRWFKRQPGYAFKRYSANQTFRPLGLEAIKARIGFAKRRQKLRRMLNQRWINRRNY